MRRPSIKTAIASIFGLIAIAYLGLAASSLYGVRELNGAMSELADRWLTSVSAVDDLVAAFKDERLAIAKHMLAESEDVMALQETKVSDSISAQRKAIGRLEGLPLADVEKKSLRDFSDLMDDYDAGWQRLRPLSRSNDSEAALKVYDGELTPMGERMSAALKQIADFDDAGAAAANLRSDKVYAAADTLIVVAVCFGAAAILGGVCVVLLNVVAPLGRITRAMKSLADGDVSGEVPFTGRHDEVGAMAAAVGVFRQAAITNRELEARAAAAREAAESDRRRVQTEAETAADERLRRATDGLAGGLKRLASGDLAFQVTEPFSAEFESLRHDLNGAVMRLAEALGDVSTATSAIDGGSQEISKSADSLSKRTEQQAASLEQTAAALDEITTNVANSSRRADEARKAAAEADASARRSGDVVANAVEAMSRIEQSSQQISNIIGVIDEIAFQTNLLALNAGVEAARAGDAGKGFAVVAQEVRELAQRSAQAAKEIKNLIGNSAAEVGKGVKLVSQTGASLKEIEQHVLVINEHMESIASSAKEQAMGLAEVNTAINSMDQVTQQNAAMVEETNAAGVSLATESARLRGLVGKFKLSSEWRPSRADGPAQAPLAKRVSSPAKVASLAAHPTRAVVSPARQLGQKLSTAFGGGSPAADGWEDF